MSLLDECQYEVADTDLVFFANHLRSRDFSRVDYRPIRALLIDDDELTVFDQQFGMSLRNVVLLQNNIVSSDSANRDFGFVEVQLDGGFPALTDRYRIHLESLHHPARRGFCRTTTCRSPNSHTQPTISQTLHPCQDRAKRNPPLWYYTANSPFGFDLRRLFIGQSQRGVTHALGQTRRATVSNFPGHRP